MKSSHNIGVVDKHLVNHSLVPKELTRGVKVLRNPLTGWKEDGSAGTELIDSTWKHLEKFIPQALTAPRTEAMHAQWVEWVRYSQWQRMLGSGDKWLAFVEACQYFETSTKEERVESVKRPGKRKLPGSIPSPASAVECDRLGQLEVDKQEALSREDYTSCAKLQKLRLQARLRIQKAPGGSRQSSGAQPKALVNRPGAAAHTGSEEQRIPLTDAAPNGDGAQSSSDVAEVSGSVRNPAEGGHVQPSALALQPLQIFGTELQNPPSHDWCALLGYKGESPEANQLECFHRGCRNLEMKHCYAIVVLRSLACLLPFQSWCSTHRKTHQQDPKNCVFCQLHEDMASLSRPGQEAFIPGFCLRRTSWAPEWTESRQECSMEALENLLFTRHRADEDLANALSLDANRASYRTFPMYQLFGGLEESVQECRAPGCGRQSKKLQMMCFLKLSFPLGGEASLETAITQAQQPEKLFQSPCPAPNCGKSLRFKTMRVTTWPLCLVVQLKRWARSGIRGRWQKDSRTIGFADTMVQGGLDYKLMAVICHVGNMRGHYICFIRSEEQWYFANDETVSACTWQQVEKGSAYIWFYVSCDRL